MRDVRVLGNKIRGLAKENGVDENKIADCIKISQHDVNMGMVGRKIFSYPQLEKIAQCLNVPMSLLLDSDNTEKYTYPIDFMNEFSNEDNLETVLDIIYDYLDVLDSINS